MKFLMIVEQPDIAHYVSKNGGIVCLDLEHIGKDVRQKTRIRGKASRQLMMSPKSQQF